MKTSLPTVLLNNNILFPKNQIKLEFDNELSKNIISEADFFHDNTLLISYSLNKLEQAPKMKEFSNIGVVAKIIRKIDLPNGKTRVIIAGVNRAFIHECLNMDDKDEILECIVSNISRTKISEKEEQVLVSKLYKEFEDYANTVPYISNSCLSEISNINNLEDMTDLIIPNLQIPYGRMIEYLGEINSVHRFEMILEDIYNEKEKFDIEKNIDLKIQKGIEDSQKEYLLREKIKMLQEQLGEETLPNDDIRKLSNLVDTLDAPDYIKVRLHEEIGKYKNMSSPFEASILRNYIEYLLKLPWNKKTTDNTNLNEVMNTLNKRHFGIDEVKSRIIEYLAVKKMSNSVNSPVICLVGPPGVGKTTFAYNIASSIGREFVKITVGGVNDPAEIIGHRRTYIGAAPGRIIGGLKKCQSSNPVFLIDEIDKMSKDVKGDPVNVLLEVLDKTQNKHFSDNYIEEEYNLSDVMFILTANSVDNIPPALRDRLEIIYINGYTEQEKLLICKDHIIPNICLEHHLNNNYIEFSELAIKDIIRYYTKESGVRELERQIAKIVRKIVKTIVVNNIKVSSIKITPDNIVSYLGDKNIQGTNITESRVGKTYSLAYTQSGGDVFAVEVSFYKGNGNLILTGNLGNDIKESALVAVDYIKSNANNFFIDIDDLLNNDIHINLPKYQVSKDGTSVGASITTAIISAFNKKIIPSDVAMTGEITLLGEIMPVGNIENKIETAIKNGIKTLFIPKDNKNDVNRISNILTNIEIVFVDNYEQIYERIYK